MPRNAYPSNKEGEIMYFEAFLEIILAFFAVFGVYSLCKFVLAVILGYDNIRIVLEVDTQEVADNIDAYLKEARENCLALFGKKIAVIVRREFLSERLVRKLERKQIKYYVI